MNATAPTESPLRIEQARARSAVYRLLADLALDPGSPRAAERTPPEERDSLRSELGQACAALARAGFDPVFLGSLVHLGETFLEADDAALAREYVRIFGHTVSTECPPYETQYGSPHIFEQTRALADLVGFYRAFGLEARPGAGERLDHLAVELEFMYALTYKEAYALEHHGSDRADLCREAQEKFVRDHLSTWVDDFAARLERRAMGGPYELYARVLGAFVAAEGTYLAVTPARLRRLEPRRGPPEPPASDARCGLSLPILDDPEIGR